MKIISHEIHGEVVIFTFDTNFKQLKFIKINDDKENNECEICEIKYQKEKNVLKTVYKKDLILLVTEFDKKDIVYTYKLQDVIVEDDTFEKGFISLFKSLKETESQSNICPIKNEKIFAKIQKSKVKR